MDVVVKGHHLPHDNTQLRPGDGVVGLEIPLAARLLPHHHAVLIQGGDISVAHVGKGAALGRGGQPQRLGRQRGDVQPGGRGVQIHRRLGLGQPAPIQGILHIARGIVRPLQCGLVPASCGLHHHQDGISRPHRIVGAKAPVVIAVDDPLAVQGGHEGGVPVPLRHVGKGGGPALGDIRGHGGQGGLHQQSDGKRPAQCAAQKLLFHGVLLSGLCCRGGPRRDLSFDKG